ERLVSEHKIHYFVGQNRSSFGGGSGAAPEITSWVEAHFTAQTVGGVTVYDLTGQAVAHGSFVHRERPSGSRRGRRAGALSRRSPLSPRLPPAARRSRPGSGSGSPR